jgi:hypothetical protein
MLKNKQRKEVSLDAETIAILTQQAEKQGRKLKKLHGTRVKATGK